MLHECGGFSRCWWNRHHSRPGLNSWIICPPQALRWSLLGLRQLLNGAHWSVSSQRLRRCLDFSLKLCHLCPSEGPARPSGLPGLSAVSLQLRESAGSAREPCPWPRRELHPGSELGHRGAPPFVFHPTATTVLHCLLPMSGKPLFHIFVQFFQPGGNLVSDTSFWWGAKVPLV